MGDEIVRCPYCVLGDHFRPMVHRPGGWLICEKCLHMAMPEEPKFNCSCKKCRKLSRGA